MTSMSPDGMRLFGVEDGSFKAFPKPRSEETLLCGVETEGDRIVCVRLARIHVDGLDATEKLLCMLTGVETEAVILGGITFGGFNIVNPMRIYEETGVPVIVYSGVKPDNESMLSALRKHFADWRVRWEIIERLGPVYSVEPFGGEPPVYFEVIGGVRDWAEDVLRASAVVSRIPEPVRVAGLIARGLSRVF
ncbi:MAG: DUF99 family protein [Candidatus Bathyarchaeota archaeon]|nr:MAG: DUF99 family protein [Candidatus Bathyarchaeota archaeon]